MLSPRAAPAPLLFCLLACSGCNTSAPPIAAASPTAGQMPTSTNNRSSARIGVQTDPRYPEAVRLYTAGDRSGAAKIIDALLTNPNLTPADREFLDRQKALCLEAPTPNRSAKTGRGEGTAVILNGVKNPPFIVSDSPSGAATQDCGPRALKIVLKQLGRDADLVRIRKECGTTDKGATLNGLAKAARAHGLKAEGIQVNREALNELKTPAIAWVNGNHYVAVLKVKDGHATLIDPNLGIEEVVETEQLLRRSGGILLTISR